MFGWNIRKGSTFSLLLLVTASQWTDRKFSVPEKLSFFVIFGLSQLQWKEQKVFLPFLQKNLNPDGHGAPSSIQLRWAIKADVSWSVQMSQSTLHRWFCLGSRGMSLLCSCCIIRKIHFLTPLWKLLTYLLRRGGYIPSQNNDRPCKPIKSLKDHWMSYKWDIEI